MDSPVENTDRYIWTKDPNSAVSDHILITKEGAVGLNCGGFVIVKPLEEWHSLEAENARLREALKEVGRTIKPEGYSCWKVVEIVSRAIKETDQ